MSWAAAVIEVKSQAGRTNWKAPVYRAGRQNDTVATFQLTVYPHSAPKAR